VPAAHAPAAAGAAAVTPETAGLADWPPPAPKSSDVVDYLLYCLLLLLGGAALLLFTVQTLHALQEQDGSFEERAQAL